MQSKFRIYFTSSISQYLASLMLESCCAPEYKKLNCVEKDLQINCWHSGRNNKYSSFVTWDGQSFYLVSTHDFPQCWDIMFHKMMCDAYGFEVLRLGDQIPLCVWC